MISWILAMSINNCLNTTNKLISWQYYLSLHIAFIDQWIYLDLSVMIDLSIWREQTDKIREWEDFSLIPIDPNRRIQSKRWALRIFGYQVTSSHAYTRFSNENADCNGEKSDMNICIRDETALIEYKSIHMIAIPLQSIWWPRNEMYCKWFQWQYDNLGNVIL